MLYQLAKKVPEVMLQKALTDGRIHPGMNGREVMMLCGKQRQATPVVGPVARLAQAIQREIMTLPLDEADGVIEQLKSLVAALAKRLQTRPIQEGA